MGAETYLRKPGISAPLYANGMHTLDHFWAIETKNGSRKGIALYHTSGVSAKGGEKRVAEETIQSGASSFFVS